MEGAVTEWTKVVRAAVLVVACGCLTAPMARAQVLYGSIVGNVQDLSGAALPGATVTITSGETNLTRSTVTNEVGSYTFANVLAGTYDVKVSLEGFKVFVKTAVPVTVNTVSRVDAALDIGQVSETLTVQSETALLQTDKADTHTELSSVAITQLPLPQNRNYQSLINLVPGSTPARMQNSEVDTPGRALNTNVNGLDSNNNGTRTDGAQNLNIFCRTTRVRLTGRDDRYGERQHEQLRRRAGQRGRRGHHRGHQVGHQRFKGRIRLLQQPELQCRPTSRP